MVCIVWFLDLRWFLKNKLLQCQGTVFAMLALLLTVLYILYGQCHQFNYQLTGEVVLPTNVCLG